MRGWTKPRWVLGSRRTANGNRHQPQTLNGMSRDLEVVQRFWFYNPRAAAFDPQLVTLAGIILREENAAVLVGR